MSASFVALALLFAPAPPTVATDAPDQTNGTFTVAPGAWQAELGLDATLPGSGAVERQVSLHLPTTLRVGLSHRVELRLFDGEPLWRVDPNDRVGGDTAFGFKIRFNDLHEGSRRPSFGIQPYVSFPTLRVLHDLESAALGTVLLWTQPVTRWLVFDANLGLELGIDRGAMPLWTFAAISAQITASHRWIPYAEIYADVPWQRADTLELGCDAGLVVVATRRLAFDVAGRATLLAPGPDYGIIAGLAVLLADGRRWRHRR